MRAVKAFALLLLLLVPAVPGLAQEDPPEPFGFRLTTWNQAMTEIGLRIESGDLEQEQVNDLRDRLEAITGETRQARLETESRIAPLTTQLQTLGPPPGEGEPPEAPDITRQRESLNTQIAALQARITQAELVANQAKDLDGRLSAYTRERSLREIGRLFPFPLAPDTLAVAIPEFFRHLGQLARSPVDWWHSVPQSTLGDRFGIVAVLLVLLGIAVGWALRYCLLRWFGRDPAVESPTYTRRLVGAVAHGLADGIVPALILFGIAYRVGSGSAVISGLLADVVIWACIGLTLFILTWALSRAALAPDLPNWRLESIPKGNARAITYWMTLLAGVFAADLFFLETMASLAVSEELDSVYLLVTNAVEAGLVLLLIRGRLWQRDEEAIPLPEDEQDEPEPEPSSDRARFWLAARGLFALIAVAAIVTSLIGYAALGSYLIKTLLASGLLCGLLFLARGLIRESIGVVLRSRFVQQSLMLHSPTRKLLKFWLRALLDLAIFAGGLFLVLPLWGVPPRDLWSWTNRILEGVTIGDITISFADVLAGILVFAVIIVLTRVIQRVLSQRVLPQTALDSGVQHSLSAGFGYIGIVLAAALGISAIGLDLDNLALIAGALSVGIGFGLQNIVSNFVSGLILLIERPVKVGDWIVAGGHEGYVKKINVRATELETFQRASVIIPNSELLSASVINWTHKNKLGRVEVPVGVAYGSDIELVMKLLDDCVRAHAQILKWPEPYVLFQGFGDSSLDFEARGYIGDVEYVLKIRSDLRVAIYRSFLEHGIEIPFPQRDLHLKDIDRIAEAMAGRPATATPKPPAKAKSAPATAGSPPARIGGESDADGDGDGGN